MVEMAQEGFVELEKQVKNFYMKRKRVKEIRFILYV
jgi:hypothetical protein